MTFQRTLKRAVTMTGVGVHSGRPAQVTVHPALPNQGIQFVRTDLPGSPRVAAHYKNVINTQLATTLGRGEARISTVEHLLSALQGMGVDNALVEVSGPEVPIMDGSAEPFCRGLEEAGIRSQNQVRPYLALRRRVELKLAEKWAVAEPSSQLMIHATVEWDHPSIGFQEFRYVEGKTSFRELSAARTFGFARDIEALRRMGLGRGGSLENAVVLDDARVLNEGGFRYPDEIVRHKVLDALGDFKLAGIAIQASVRLHRAGHDLHSQLLAAIFRDPDNFEIIDGNELEREERAVSRLRASLVHAAAL
jgi:UDP-3-O-[3-hydroxymyristoyl] N-acetylglucosamine deacetylase